MTPAPTSSDALLCTLCGGPHAAPDCEGFRAAGAAGARPPGVPLRVTGGYLDARAMMRVQAWDAACRVLSWLLGHLAELRGAPAGSSLADALEALRADGAVTREALEPLRPRALEAEPSAERAWALMSLAEHAFGRLYLTPPTPAP